MAEKEITIDDLIKLISSGKATATDKMKLAEMLNSSAKEEAANEFIAKIDDIKEYIKKKGLAINDVANALKDPMPVIFRWVDSEGKEHTRFQGEKGKPPAWTSDLKIKVSKADALSMAIGDKGKTFIENLYTPK